MSKINKLIKNARVIILIVFLVLAVVAIYPNPGAEGVAIRAVIKNSSASLAGVESPSPTSTPMSREVIKQIGNRPIKTLSDYYDYTSTLEINRTIRIVTNKKSYLLRTKPDIETILLGERENKTIEEVIQVNKTVNDTVVLVNKTIYKTVEVNKTISRVIGVQDIGLSVYEAPSSNVRKGLDLQGGTRVLLQPEKKLSASDMEILLLNMKERLNIYGLSDVLVREASDLSGNQYIAVEIAGASKEEVKDLLAKQGKFEAKIGNDTVFKGGQDITYVCRSADCSGIDPRSGCNPSGSLWYCRFTFSISLTPGAAQRQADITSTLDVVTEEGGSKYLSKQLDLFLDNENVDSLNIGSDLKGRPVTDIAISGGGQGTTRQAAVFDALNNMKKLQTILITGSLPVKLEIVKIDALSPVLGEEFVNNALLIGIVAILGVALVIFIRFRKIEIAVPVVITMFSELILLLGFAALVGWNLDLAAIAGILIAVGTGVDDQIVIADEILKGEKQALNWKERIKKAFFIIVAAYFTTVVAMLPLLSAGAGLLKGFAFTTIAGVSFGVLVARPAFAAIIEVLLK